MNNLVRKYNEYNNNYEEYLLLGTAMPSSLKEESDNENIVKCFLFSYSFLGLNALDIHPIERLKKILTNKINLIDEQKKVTLEQKWWCLALLYLQIGAEYHKFDFFTSTCETIINSIETLKSNELINYCNSINDSLSYLIGYDLRIRPHLDKDIKNDVVTIPIYSKLTSKNEQILGILKKYITIEELLSKDILREISLIHNIGFEHDQWDIIFDIFCGHMVSQVTLDTPFGTSSEKDDIRNSIELSILNISEDSDFMPKDISIVSESISELLF